MNHIRKNVLILSASSRKEGNLDILCLQFEKGAKEVGHKTEMIQSKNKDPYRFMANAQTGNVVLMSRNFMQGDWYKGLRYMLPLGERGKKT